jgi:predicted GNAT family N-acyltransferase
VTAAGQVRIEPADWRRFGHRLRAVREAVFVQEQGIPADLEWDDRDADAFHLIALTDDDQAIGVARLLDDGRIGRMAVLRPWRGQGIGTRLLAAMCERAARAGFEKVFLHAQLSALSFYRRRGFVPAGEPFDEAGIPHRLMICKLQREDGSKP